MRKTEIWALESRRIMDYFQEQAGARQTGSGFVFDNCQITLTELEDRRVAGMRLPRTQITFEGEEASVDAICRRFFLRFLSAGG